MPSLSLILQKLRLVPPSTEQRTSKESMSDASPKPVRRTSSGRAIVFDPIAQKITTKKISTLQNQKPLKTIAPKWFNHVDIYDESEFRRLIATLNLGGLGWSASMKRLCGKCNDIYMMKLPDEPTPALATAA